MPYSECYIPRHLLSILVRKKGKSEAKSICQIVTKSKLILFAACMHAKALQSCPTLCDPMDCSLPGFSVHRILQARILRSPPGDLPDPGVEPETLMSPALAGGFFTISDTSEAPLINYMLCLVAQPCLTLCDTMDCRLPSSSVLGVSPGKNIGVGFHALQGIFATQGSNPSLLHCRLYSNIIFF